MAKHGRRTGEAAADLLRPLLKGDSSSMLGRVREQAAQHPYRTVGVAALAGLVLSSSVGRTLAGWAGLRLGWDLLIEALREKEAGAQAS